MQCSYWVRVGNTRLSLVLAVRTHLQGCRPKLFIRRYTVTQHDGSAHGGMGDLLGPLFSFLLREIQVSTTQGIGTRCIGVLHGKGV